MDSRIGPEPGLPADLAGPVEVALARARDEIPPPGAAPGGYAYDLKWDGFRLVVVRGRARTRLWSRTGTDLTARFPDVAAAAHALPAGVVLDGEVVPGTASGWTSTCCAGG